MASAQMLVDILYCDSMFYFIRMNVTTVSSALISVSEWFKIVLQDLKNANLAVFTMDYISIVSQFEVILKLQFFSLKTCFKNS